jgi:hypothetical protein
MASLVCRAGTSADGSSIRVKACGDILLSLPQAMSITDVSITHPLSINALSAAAAMAGAASARRDQQKRAAYARVEPNGYIFVPISVESYGRLGQPAMELLHKLGNEAAHPGGVSRASCVAGALRELRPVQKHFVIYRASVGMLARVSGTGFRAGMGVPMDEPVQ